MKAYIQKKYGGPEVFKLEQVPKPLPKEGEVLVKIKAVAINDWDWGMMRGLPREYRLFLGLTRPRNLTPGMELAGVIESCGPGVETFKPGDAVYGDTSEFGFGGFAEYVSHRAEAFRLKPQAMSFEEAAAIPHAAMLAVQGLVEKGQIADGQNILINGGGGGVGTLGLQIAKQFKVTVTGVDTGPKLHMMAQLGYDRVIDYKEDDFTRLNDTYDLILDCKSSRPPRAITRVLTQNGRYITVGGKSGRLIQILLWKFLVGPFTQKSLSVLALEPNKDLGYIEQMYEQGRLQCRIDGPHKFEDLPSLVQYFGEGRHSGKVIVGL